MMHETLRISLLLSIIFIQTTGYSQGLSNYTITKYKVNSSVRAIEAIDENTVWFAGSNGLYGHTKDGGKNWIIDSLSHPLVPKLEFRSIAVTSNATFILSIGSPALLFKIIDGGKDWKIVYQEDHPKAFYDAMNFWDDQYGIAMGDPTEGCLSILLTNDGGDTWNKVNCDKLLPVVDGEAAFAASDTNISLHGNEAWIATGGAKARVFHSSDKGLSWEVSDTPIIEGGAMTGIYTVDFYNENNGVIFGGDWNDKENNTQNKATTRDGGKTWTLVNDGSNPGYRSCVQYLPGTDGKQLFAVGIPGISYSFDAGTSWENLNDQEFYTIRFSKSGNIAWLAGKNVLAKMMLNK